MVQSALSKTVGALRSGTTLRAGGSRSATFRDKAPFLAQVFAHLLLQLAITATVYTVIRRSEKLSESVQSTWVVVLAFLGTLLAMLVMAFVPMPAAMKAALFTAVSTLIGVTISAAGDALKPELVRRALYYTLLIFGVMFAMGLLASFMELNLAVVGVVLFVALLVATVVDVVSTMTRDGKRSKPVSSAFVFIFGLYVLYDTWNIMRRDYQGDFVTASLDYYFDVINIFLELALKQN